MSASSAAWAAAWVGAHIATAWPSPSAWPAPPPAPTPPAVHVDAKPSAAASLPPAPPPPSPVVAPVVPPAPSILAIPDGCGNDRVDEVARALSVWAARFKDAQAAAYTDRGCTRADVFCLDRLGEAGADALPDRVRAGQSFSVEVILPEGDRGKVAVSTSGSAKTGVAAGPFADAVSPSGTPSPGLATAGSCALSPLQRDTLKAAAAPIAQLSAHPGLEAWAIPAGSADDEYWMNATNASIFADWSAWIAAHASDTPHFTAVEAKVEVPFAEQSLEVDFERVEGNSSSPTITAHYAVWIDSGQYHLEASVLVPFVYRGRRIATLTPTPSGTELQVGLNQDWHVTAAIMVDLFPFGRQKGQVSSFQHCRSGSCAENWLGIQFGTGLSSIFQEWFLGLLFEPVSGLALAAGGALLKGDFLGQGLAEGMLLPSAAEFSAKSDYMIRPYFGVAVTSDIFQTLDRSSVFARIW